MALGECCTKEVEKTPNVMDHTCCADEAPAQESETSPCEHCGCQFIAPVVLDAFSPKQAPNHVRPARTDRSSFATDVLELTAYSSIVIPPPQSL
jgi:hypothetical protein